MLFYLMHKDIKVAKLDIDKSSGTILKIVDVYNIKHTHIHIKGVDYIGKTKKC